MKGSRLFYAVSAIIVFIFSLQLLSQSTQAMKPIFESLLRQFVTTSPQSLGLGWLSAYVMLNGATVTAIGMALLESSLLSELQAFTLVSGSRLGASFILVLIGIIEYVQGKSSDLGDSCSIGILTFIITYSIYLPGILLGYLLLDRFNLGFMEVLPPDAVQYSLTAAFEPSVQLVSAHTGPATMFGTSVFLLFMSLKQFDKAFTGLEEDKIRNNYVRFLLSNKWYSFIAGSLFTLLTMSVSLSIGIIVPLYNKGYIKRKEIIPYIMGANITTFSGTIVAAGVIGTSVGMKITLLLALAVAMFTVISLYFFDSYFRGLKYFFDRIITDRRFLGGFVLSLTLLPLAFLIL